MSIWIRSSSSYSKYSMVSISVEEALELLEGGLAEKIKEELDDMRTEVTRTKSNFNRATKDLESARKRAKRLGIV